MEIELNSLKVLNELKQIPYYAADSTNNYLISRIITRVLNQLQLNQIQVITTENDYHITMRYPPEIRPEERELYRQLILSEIEKSHHKITLLFKRKRVLE